MEIGTAEPLVATEKEPKLRSGKLRSGGGNSGGNRRPGGGGNGPDRNDSEGAEASLPNKSRILTAFLLMVVTMTFGGLIAAYIVIATNGVAEWRPFTLPVSVWISTILILVSSVTYHFSKRAIDRNHQVRAKKLLIATTALGGAFIASQLTAWVALVQRGLYVSGNPYTGFFYILTAVHAVHVLGGVIALGVILLKTWRQTEDPILLKRRRELAETVGWYWHFMDGLWIVLFVLLGFWK